MVIDFHTHIFPPEIRSRRSEFFEGEPEFRLLYESQKSRMAGAREIVAAMDEQEVDQSVVFGFPWKDANICRRHNDYIMEAVSRHPRRLIGFGCMDPFHPDAADEAARCLAAGLSGIGELALYGNGFDQEALRRLAPLMAAAGERRRPILIHTNEPVGHQYPGKAPMTLGQIDELVKRFANNTLVLAHWGGGLFFYHLLKKEIKAHLENVYFDTAASPFLYDPGIYAAAAGIIGAEKILFGSDFPLIKPRRYFNEMASAGLSEDEMAAICGGNAAALLAPGR